MTSDLCVFHNGININDRPKFLPQVYQYFLQKYIFKSSLPFYLGKMTPQTAQLPQMHMFKSWEKLFVCTTKVNF